MLQLEEISKNNLNEEDYYLIQMEHGVFCVASFDHSPFMNTWQCYTEDGNYDLKKIKHIWRLPND